MIHSNRPITVGQRSIICLAIAQGRWSSMVGGHKLCVEIEILTGLCQHHYISRLATLAARQGRQSEIERGGIVILMLKKCLNNGQKHMWMAVFYQIKDEFWPIREGDIWYSVPLPTKHGVPLYTPWSTPMLLHDTVSIVFQGYPLDHYDIIRWNHSVSVIQVIMSAINLATLHFS